MRALVDHVTRGNLDYAALLRGASAADFLRMRDADALGTDPLGAFRRSVTECAGAFDGAVDRVLDHPLGRISGAQALAVRTADTTHRFFAAPRGMPGPTPQERLLHRMGR